MSFGGHTNIFNLNAVLNLKPLLFVDVWTIFEKITVFFFYVDKEWIKLPLQIFI